MATTTTWVMTMAMRLAGNKRGKGGQQGKWQRQREGGGQQRGRGSKAMAIAMAMAKKMVGEWSAMATKRLMAKATWVAGKQRQ
jgi:hypothetical protein